MQSEQRAAVGGDHVADVHQPMPGAAIDGRADGGVLHIQAGRLDSSGALLHLSFTHRDCVFARVVLFLRDGFLTHQTGSASQLQVGKLQRRFLLGQRGFRLVKLGLVRARIDDKKQVALSQFLAILEMDLRDAP